MTTVAFIGVGTMGGPMAVNLVRAGFDVVALNRTQARLEPVVRAGARAASSVVDACRDADVVVTMLPDGPDVETVVLGDDGVLANARSGALLIDCSTIDPGLSVRIAEAAVGRGIAALDAPVSGGQQGAIDGTLTVMVGGRTEHVEAARPVLEAVGRTIVHVGPSGSGQVAKAANQLLVAGTIALLAEAIVFLEASEVDVAAALTAISGGLAGSTVLERKSPMMVARRFEPGFRLRLQHKDLGIYLAAARSREVVSPMGSMTAQLVAAAVARGDGGLDHAGLFRVINELAGREPAGPSVPPV